MQKRTHTNTEKKDWGSGDRNSIGTKRKIKVSHMPLEESQKEKKKLVCKIYSKKKCPKFGKRHRHRFKKLIKPHIRQTQQQPCIINCKTLQ
jgi:hypothetical protein